MTEFFTKGDIAKKSQLTGQAVAAAEKRGELTPIARTIGGIALYDRQQAEKFIKSRTQNDRI